MSATQHKLGCIIISNSDDLLFMEPCLKQIAPIMKEIVIAIGRQLWNGEPENEDAIAAFINKVKGTNEYANINIIRYSVPGDAIGIMKGQVSPAMYWEGHARYMAHRELSRNIDYILLLDSDEIVDGAAFTKWLDTGNYKRHDAMKLKNYWYWRDPIYRARDYYEDSVVLVKNGTFNAMHLFSNMGRHGVFEASNSALGLKARNVQGIDGMPMVHHFSWVRSKDQMLRKVRAWGHRNDRHDWDALVEKEFACDFSGTDFIKGLKYDVVDNVFNICI